MTEAVINLKIQWVNILSPNKCCSHPLSQSHLNKFYTPAPTHTNSQNRQCLLEVVLLLLSNVQDGHTLHQFHCDITDTISLVNRKRACHWWPLKTIFSYFLPFHSCMNHTLFEEVFKIIFTQEYCTHAVCEYWYCINEAKWNLKMKQCSKVSKSQKQVNILSTMNYWMGIYFFCFSAE